MTHSGLAVSELERAEVSVALVFSDPESSAHLRTALAELGADIVCDAPVATLDAAAIDASGARVVLVNLDEGVGERLDDVDATLQEGRYRIVFDDPEISAGLDGWARSRWLRHLAAKLRNDGDVDPPRPAAAGAAAEPQLDAAQAAWMSEALDVLADAPATPADVEPPADVRTLVDLAPTDPDPVVAAVSAAPNLIADADNDLASLAPLTAAPPAPAAGLAWNSLELTLPDAASEKTPPPVTPSPEATFDAELRAALADTTAEPSDTAAAFHADADADDVDDTTEAGDLTALEAELNAAFGSDTLAALDADAAPDAAPKPLPTLDVLDEAPETEPAADPTPIAEAVTAPTAPIATPPPTDRVPPAPPAPAESPVTPIAAATGNEPPLELSLLDELAPIPVPVTPVHAADTRDFDIDYLSLVDLEPPAPPEAAPWEAVEHRLDPDDVREAAKPAPEPTPAPVVAQHAEPARDDDLAAMLVHPTAPSTAPEPHTAQSAANAAQDPVVPAATFGIDVVRAEDYLAPDAPAADPTDAAEPIKVEVVRPEAYLARDVPVVDPAHEIVTPERVSLTDAVAPEVLGAEPQAAPATAPATITRVVVLAASVGGPDAVREFLSVLPEQFPATFVLVQHLSPEFVPLMVNQFARTCALPVRVPDNGDHAFGGEVLVVPHGRTVNLLPSGEIQLAPVATGPAAEPSIEATMQMAAGYGAGAIGIVFSGLANDAVSGARAVVAAGGAVWVQDSASCVVSTMPDAVGAAGLATFVGTPRAMAERLIATFANGTEA